MQNKVVEGKVELAGMNLIVEIAPKQLPISS
jgi:hypothetical protein